MAVAGPTKVDLLGFDGMAQMWEWTGLGNENGAWLTLDPLFSDRTVMVYGTFGGTVTIQGTLETGTPAAPVTLKDPSQNAITFTANGIDTILDNCLKIRPSGGVGVTDVTVRVLAVRRF